MVYLVVLIILYIEGKEAFECKRDCPSDKPYCSEVGCIYECPEPFYINGSNCVSGCGELFVDEKRHCVASCSNTTFYKETLRQVMSLQYLERKCVNCNQPDEYVFNGSCVKVCPEYARNIDKNNCVSQCPVDRPFKTNVTIQGLMHSKCTRKCPQMEDDNFCRDSCPDNKVIFKSSCVDKCPSSSPYLHFRQCMTKCPFNTPSAGNGNRTCVNRKCPEKRPFVVNNTCVEKCPNTDQLIFTDIYIGLNFCVKSCEGKYRFNNSCVNVCPPLTVAVNNSCLNHCPSNTSYTCMIKKGYQCGENPFRDSFDHTVCVNTCPQNMLIWKQSCVYTCPDGLALFGNECADTCPLYYPYKSNSTKTRDCDSAGRCREVKTILKCVRKCPADSYVVNNTCLSHCPYPQLHTGNKCVLTCPTSVPFTHNSTLVLESWTYEQVYYYNRREWRYRRIKQEKVIQKCINSCGDGELILNLTCVSTCPDDQPYIHNRTCLWQKCETPYSADSSFGIICTDKCKPQQFVHNKKCVETCPITNLLFNRTCVDHCPESHLLTSTYTVGETCDTSCTAQKVIKECVKKCPTGLFEVESTCVEFCHKPLYTISNKCVVSCPLDRPYTITSSITVAKWSKYMNRYKKISISEDILKCEAKCPADKVLSGTSCADNCPLNSRFIRNGKCTSDSCKTKYKFYTSAGIWCFDKCPNDLFIHNGTCYLQCPDNLYAIGQNCTNDCPPTHKVVNDETIVKQYYNCSWLSEELCTDSLLYIKRCRNECPEKKILHNNKCLDFCLKSTFLFNNACVTKCPESHPFMQPTLVTIPKWKNISDDEWYLGTVNPTINICTGQCHGDYPLHFENTCFNDCPKLAPYLNQNSCVKKCPGDKMIDIKTKVCVDKCANDRGLFNHSCHYNCPEKSKYIFNAHCVSECPHSHPVAIKENRFICQKSCGNDQIFKDGECISKYDCDDPMFEYDGICLRQCPDGFVWLGSCIDTIGAKIAIVVLGVVFTVLLGYSRHGIMDNLYVLRLMFATEEELKQIQKQHLRLSSKRKHEMEDEIPLQMMFSYTDNEETCPMEMQDENTGNNRNSAHTRL